MDALPFGLNPQRRVYAQMGFTTGYTYAQYFECMLRWNHGDRRVAHEKAKKIWRKSIPYNPNHGHTLPPEDEDQVDEDPDFPTYTRHHHSSSRRPQHRRSHHDNERNNSPYTRSDMMENIQAAIQDYYHSDHSRSPHPHHQPFNGRGRRLDDVY